MRFGILQEKTGYSRNRLFEMKGYILPLSTLLILDFSLVQPYPSPCIFTQAIEF
jgi:hypothetical protein